jgi:hypothetical protein
MKSRIHSAVAAFAFALALQAHAQNPVPQIVGPVQPMAVAPASGAFTLRVYGANFVPGAVVNWNGQPRSTSFVSAHEVQAQILASDVATHTAGYITVTNPAPGGGKSSTYAQVEVHSAASAIVTTNPAHYTFGWYALLAADFNNDNILDLVGPGPEGVDLRIGNGDGTFRFGSIAGRNYRSPLGLVYGDFNGDGNLDIAYVSGDSNNITNGKQVIVMLGDGTGKFTLGSAFTSWRGFSLLAVGDFNGDGKLDIAASQGTTLGIYLGNGDGTFTSFKTYPFPGAGNGQDAGGDAIIAADFNGDGKLDLLTLNQYGDIYLLTGMGDGTFRYPPALITSYPIGCGAPSSLEVSDFNKDGALDIAFCTHGQLGVAMNNGDGTFQTPVFYPASDSYEIATGDFLSNGNTDIVISDNITNQFLLLPGNGDGTFQSEELVTLPTANVTGDLAIAVGDFNDNGLLDFVLDDYYAYIFVQ